MALCLEPEAQLRSLKPLSPGLFEPFSPLCKMGMIRELIPESVSEDEIRGGASPVRQAMTSSCLPSGPSPPLHPVSPLLPTYSTLVCTTPCKHAGCFPGPPVSPTFPTSCGNKSLPSRGSWRKASVCSGKTSELQDLEHWSRETLPLLPQASTLFYT